MGKGSHVAILPPPAFTPGAICWPYYSMYLSYTVKHQVLVKKMSWSHNGCELYTSADVSHAYNAAHSDLLGAGGKGQHLEAHHHVCHSGRSSLCALLWWHQDSLHTGHCLCIFSIIWSLVSYHFMYQKMLQGENEMHKCNVAHISFGSLKTRLKQFTKNICLYYSHG